MRARRWLCLAIG